MQFSQDTPRVLRANIGMNFSEVKKESTVSVLDSDSGFRGGRLAVGQSQFAFEVAGSQLRFDNCRYFWMETNDGRNPRLQTIHVGLCGRKVPREELAGVLHGLHERLAQDGWTAAESNRAWVKGGTALRIDCSRSEETEEYMVSLRLGERPSAPPS